MLRKIRSSNKFTYLFISLITVILISCSNNDDPEKEVIDNIKPSITCFADINESVAVFASGMVVNYTNPVGTDNNEGAITSQTQGLASGSIFPLGTTINTFLVTDSSGNTASCSFNVTITRDAPSINLPFFIDSNPTPSGKKWIKIEDLSDEFNVDSFDEAKWKNTDPARWIGRPPGLFKKNTVSQSEGSLKLTADILPTPEEVNGNTFTHAGSNITSNKSVSFGHYFECRMKASKTFMSSTFWLINVRNEGTGCDIRTTELDIQECVGQITSTANWAQSKDEKMSSNTHSRNTSCTETPTGSAGNDSSIGAKAWEDYHVYAAWWKNPNEVEFYLDGKKVYTIVPKADFDLPMYLRLVVETYDWNPVPSDGGMNGSKEDRTTSYDWVRTWKLENL